MAMRLLRRLVSALLLLTPVAPFPSYMRTSHCSKSLSVGSTIMGSAAVASTSSSDASVSFDGHECGGAYTPGATLTARFKGANQWVMEVSGGAFDEGYCPGNVRSGTDGSTVTAPTNGSDILLWAGYGRGCARMSASAARGGSPTRPSSRVQVRRDHHHVDVQAHRRRWQWRRRRGRLKRGRSHHRDLRCTMRHWRWRRDGHACQSTRRCRRKRDQGGGSGATDRHHRDRRREGRPRCRAHAGPGVLLGRASRNSRSLIAHFERPARGS